MTLNTLNKKSLTLKIIKFIKSKMALWRFSTFMMELGKLHRLKFQMAKQIIVLLENRLLLHSEINFGKYSTS